jgi:hypothetical protein
VRSNYPEVRLFANCEAGLFHILPLMKQVKILSRQTIFSYSSRIIACKIPCILHIYLHFAHLFCLNLKNNTIPLNSNKFVYTCVILIRLLLLLLVLYLKSYFVHECFCLFNSMSFYSTLVKFCFLPLLSFCPTHFCRDILEYRRTFFSSYNK